MSVPPTSTFPIVDRLLTGGLEQMLRDARSKRETYSHIAERIRQETGVELSAQTISNWCRDLGIEKAAVSA